MERSTKSYEISSLDKFADSIHDEIERLEEGKENWDSLDDAFIERVRTLHEQISLSMQSSLSDHLTDNEDFQSDFIDWVDAQGFEYKELDGDERDGDPGGVKKQPLVRALNQWYDVDATKELIDRAASEDWIDEPSTNLYTRGDIFE